MRRTISRPSAIEATTAFRFAARGVGRSSRPTSTSSGRRGGIGSSAALARERRRESGAPPSRLAASSIVSPGSGGGGDGAADWNSSCPSAWLASVSSGPEVRSSTFTSSTSTLPRRPCIVGTRDSPPGRKETVRSTTLGRRGAASPRPSSSSSASSASAAATRVTSSGALSSSSSAAGPCSRSQFAARLTSFWFFSSAFLHTVEEKPIMDARLSAFSHEGERCIWRRCSCCAWSSVSHVIALFTSSPNFITAFWQSIGSNPIETRLSSRCLSSPRLLPSAAVACEGSEAEYALPVEGRGDRGVPDPALADPALAGSRFR